MKSLNESQSRLHSKYQFLSHIYQAGLKMIPHPSPPEKIKTSKLVRGAVQRGLLNGLNTYSRQYIWLP